MTATRSKAAPWRSISHVRVKSGPQAEASVGVVGAVLVEVEEVVGAATAADEVVGAATAVIVAAVVVTEVIVAAAMPAVATAANKLSLHQDFRRPDLGPAFYLTHRFHRSHGTYKNRSRHSNDSPSCSPRYTPKTA